MTRESIQSDPGTAPDEYGGYRFKPAEGPEMAVYGGEVYELDPVSGTWNFVPPVHPDETGDAPHHASDS
jgi:hypothetical protein